jgi:hypothetical protein
MEAGPPRVRRRRGWDEAAPDVTSATPARANKWDQPGQQPFGVSAELAARTHQGAAAIVAQINQVSADRWWVRGRPESRRASPRGEQSVGHGRGCGGLTALASRAGGPSLDTS